MKIKRVDDKPMVIHVKEKARLRVKSVPKTKIKGRNVLTVTRSPKIAGTKGAIGNKTTDKKKIIKQKKENSKEAAQKDSGLRSRYLSTKKEKEAAIGKKSGSIRTAGAVGVGTALKQMEGGDEIYESTQVMTGLSRPAASATEAGRRLYRSNAAKKQAERRIKKVNGQRG